MAKNIFNIHARIQGALKKGIGSYFTPDRVDAEIHSESMNLWKKYVAMYEKDADITAIMDVFRRTENVSLISGLGTMTAAFQRPVSVADSNGVKIDIVDIGMWYDRLNNPLKAPTTTYPACTFENRTITVRPASLTSCVVKYLKYPTAPVYAFTQVGTRYVYDDANSVALEFPEILHDDIVNRVLANLGLTNREPQVIQYSNLEMQKEGR